MARPPGVVLAGLLLPGVLLLGGCGEDGGGGTTTDPPATSGANGEQDDAAPDVTSSEVEQSIEQDIFERVNDERRERGLQPLEWHEDLATYARAWSEDMAGREVIEHQELTELIREEELSGLRSIGENVFQSTGPVPAGVIHSGWMESPGHRVNVLQPGFDVLGIGVTCGEDGGVWATQLFGRRTGSDAPPLQRGETPPAEPIARPGDDGPSCRQ